jgi:hypothetical protein
MKLCECGCGRATKLTPRTRHGYRAGEFQRFVRGHNSNSNSNAITTERMLEALRLLAGRSDHGYPSGDEWNAWAERPCCRSIVIRRFGSWSGAVLAAGYQPRHGRDVAISAVECADAIRGFVAAEGHVPTRQEWASYATREDVMCVETICRRLGNGRWGEAVKRAGFTPQRQGENRVLATPRHNRSRNRRMITAGKSDVQVHRWDPGAMVETVGGER